MASAVTMVSAGFSYSGLGLKPHFAGGAQRRAAVVVRAEAINPDIRKTEDKVVDSVLVTELSKPLIAYCRDGKFRITAEA